MSNTLNKSPAQTQLDHNQNQIYLDQGSLPTELDHNGQSTNLNLLKSQSSYQQSIDYQASTKLYQSSCELSNNQSLHNLENIQVQELRSHLKTNQQLQANSLFEAQNQGHSFKHDPNLEQKISLVASQENSESQDHQELELERSDQNISVHTLCSDKDHSSITETNSITASKDYDNNDKVIENAQDKVGSDAGNNFIDKVKAKEVTKTELTGESDVHDNLSTTLKVEQISLAQEQQDSPIETTTEPSFDFDRDLLDLNEEEAQHFLNLEQKDSQNDAAKVLNRAVSSALIKAKDNIEPNNQEAHSIEQSTKEDLKSEIVLNNLTEQNKVAESEAKLDQQQNQDLKDEFAEFNIQYQDKYHHLNLKEGDICPHCRQGLLFLKHTIKADLLGCSNFPTCGFHYFVARNNQVQTVKLLQRLCPQCSQPMAVKKGKFGLFIGCSNYPECDYIYKEQEQEQIECPICHKGQIKARRTKNGRTFYGCNNYPECDYVLNGAPYLRVCPECGFPVAFKKKVKAGTALICANSLCKSRRRKKQFILEEHCA